MTLHIIQTLADPLLNLLADDPVRPEIPAEFRVSDTTEIFVLQDDQTLEPQAVVCVAYRSMVPDNVVELAAIPTEDTHVAVFYTIWSYKPGAGRKMIQQARLWITRNRKNIDKFVTLSPPTDMARIFHLRNGAEVFRINSETVNYLYP
jgi:hypothetical protein